jgi:hypothetical protein
MIYKDSYLARPPIIINRRQRLCLEAISFSVNSILLSVSSIRNLVNMQPPPHPANAKDFSPSDKIFLCNNLWSTVDQVYMLCSILRSIDIKAPFIDIFIDKYLPTISELRNTMDHLGSKINNILKTKKLRPTLFGCLSYLHFNSNLRTETGQYCGLIVMIHFGNLSVADNSENFPLINPLGKPIKNGASLFQFSAFDEVLLIDTLHDDIIGLADSLEFAIFQSVSREAAKMTARSESTDGLLSQPSSHMVILAISFDDPPPPQPKDGP